MSGLRPYDPKTCQVFSHRNDLTMRLLDCQPLLRQIAPRYDAVVSNGKSLE